MLIVYKPSGEVAYAEPGYPQCIESNRVMSSKGVSVGIAEGWAVVVLEDSPILDALAAGPPDGGAWYSPLMYPTDFPGATAIIAQSRAIDAATGNAINKAVHPLTGIDESIGILRDQMVQVLNALGLPATDDFARLNEIAIAAVTDGAKKKAAL